MGLSQKKIRLRGGLQTGCMASERALWIPDRTKRFRGVLRSLERYEPSGKNCRSFAIFYTASSCNLIITHLKNILCQVIFCRPAIELLAVLCYTESMATKYVGVKSLFNDAKTRGALTRAMTDSVNKAAGYWAQHTKEYSGGVAMVRQVTIQEGISGTDDDRVHWVDEGTKRHPITGDPLAFNSAYTAKTAIATIPSHPGGPSGTAEFAYAVDHPGVEPRNISETIAKATQKDMVKIYETAFKSIQS